jgi:hypothetical protein
MMTRFATLATLALLSISSSVQAAPLFGGLFGSNDKAGATTALTEEQVNELIPFAHFARASFCSAATTQVWKCGEACDAEPQTEPLLAGGDDQLIPNFFVAFDPPSKSIVVAHQGTAPKNFLSVSNDIRLLLVTPDQNRFPGTEEKGIKVHEGFEATFARTADQIRTVVEDNLKKKNATRVRVTGHSLGAAIGLLEAMSLRTVLDPSVTIETVLFGLPRVGNQEFADLVDATDINLKHVVNNQDIVPQIPPQFLGYRHPAGEVFQTAESVVECEGQENSACSAGNNIINGSRAEHDGPYLGVPLGNKSCPL